MPVMVVQRSQPMSGCGRPSDAAQERVMFRIRAVTTPMIDESGLPFCAGELRVGPRPIPFLIDLRHWSLADYERQWRASLSQLMQGDRSTVLLTAYRGPGDVSHVMWVLWQDEDHVHVQEQTVVAAELDAPFDPATAHLHAGSRVPAADNALPIREWRVPITDVYAAAMGIRWPL